MKRFLFSVLVLLAVLSLCCAGYAAPSDRENSYWLKINPIGRPPAQPSETYNLLESRLRKVSAGDLDGMDFFRSLGRDGMTMRDVMAFKEEFIRLRGEELRKTGALSPVDALPGALEAWERAFGEAERSLMDVRRKGVERAFAEGVRRYRDAHPDFPYLVRMDAGASSGESYQELRFEGDIDISTLAAQVENAAALRDFIASAVRDSFNLDMTALDALVTAHRQAALDVYITQPAADWAEADSLKRGRLQEIVIENGEVGYRDVTDPVERVFIFANLKNNIRMRDGAPDELVRLMDEPPDRMTSDMEPAVSLEMLRHMITDALQARLAYHEKILKLAKYVDRSAAIAKGPLGDTALAAWARQVTLVKQNKGLDGGQRLKRILEISEPLLGDPRDFAGLDRAILSLGERASALIRDNVAKGIDARLKLIDDARTPAEKDGERRKLLSELEETFRAYVEKGVDFPPKAHETMIALADSLKVTVLNIPASELERMKRYLDLAAEKPGSLDLALGMAWSLFEGAYSTADGAIDAFNNWIDYLDNHTVARLRAMNPEVFLPGPGGKTRAVTIPIGRINDRLNASILGAVGNSLPFKAVNLGQELYAYVSGFREGKDMSESVSNVATELFRSRVPGGDIVEAAVMENYTRAAIGVVYLLFPTLAVPEALYGMGTAAAEWYVGAWQQWQYDEMVDELYDGTVFEPTREGTWKVKSITYSLPGGGSVTVGRDEAFTLPERVPKISNILVPQVRTHPSIAMYHELLAKKELSDGQSGIPAWPRRYLNLSLYGERMYEKYVSEVKTVTRQYFAEVIAELEKRKAFDQGTNEKKLREIGEELGCGDSLLEKVGSGREAQEAVIAHWEEWLKVHAALMEFRERWSAFFILTRKPSCSPESIRIVLEEDRKDLEEAKKALREAAVAVEEIVGRSRADEKTLQPAVRARAGALIYPSGTPERRRMIGEYREYLESLRSRQTPPGVRISGPDTVGEGMEEVFTVVLDRELRSARYDWKFASGGDGEVLEGDKTSRIRWAPSSPGKKVLEVHVLADLPGADWVRAVHPVTVLSAEETPRPEVRLTCPVNSFSAGEVVPLTAETEEFGLGGEGFEWYIWFADGRRIASTAERTISFDGVGYEGRTVEIRVEARTKSRFVSASALSLEVLPPGGTGGDLRVLLAPDITEVAAGTPLRFSGTAFPRKGGGTLKYQWSVNGEFAGDGDVLHFDTAPWEGKTVEIVFYAAQVLDGTVLFEGSASRKISVVKETPLAVALEPHPSKVDDTETIRLAVKDPRDGVEYEWQEWDSVSRRWSSGAAVAGRRLVKSARGLTGQSFRFRVTARDGKGRTASAESGLIEITEPSWPGPEEEEPVQDKEKSDPDPEKKDDEKAVVPGDAGEGPGKDGAAENDGKLRLELPATVMEGDIVTVKALLPPGMAEQAADSFRWSSDPSQGRRSFVILGETVGGTDGFGGGGGERTARPETEIQFTPHQNTRGVRGSVGVTVYRKLRGNQKGAPMESLAEVYSPVEVIPMGCSVAAPASWAGGPNEEGVLLTLDEDTPRGSVRGEFLLQIGTWRGRTLESVEKQVVTNNQYGTLERVTVDGYEGYLAATGPSYSIKRTPDGRFVTGGQVVLNGLAIKGEAALDFRSEIKFFLAEEKIPESDPETARFARELMSQLRSILASIRVVPDPKRTTGPADGAGEEKKDVAVTLRRVSPPAGPVTAGTPVEFLATAEGVKKGDVFFRFEPSTEVSFSPPESEAGRTNAVFSEPGTVRIWAVALDRDGTLGESEQVEIEVTGPDLTITATPPKPKVGQEVQVKAEAKPGLPEGASVVWALEGNASRSGARAADSTEYSFLPREAGQYVLKAEARSPGGETLAEKTLAVEVAGYDVVVTIHGPAGPRPQEWVQGQGLRTVEKDTFFRDEHVRVKAEVKDPGAPKDLRWKWIPGPETSLASSGIGQEATLYGTAAGTASARVEVRDKEDLLLGAASVSFPVTELPPELKAPPLKGVVRADPEPGTVNGRIALSASGEGGKPPYTFRWGGPVTGSGDILTFIPDRPGTFRFTLLVQDSAGRQVTVNRDVEVKPFVVTLSGLPQRVVLGETVSCRVDYPLSPPGSKVNRSPMPRIRLSGSPEVRWNPAEGTGPGFIGRAARTGVADIRAEVRGAGGVVLGVSDPVQVTVETPDLSLVLPEYVTPGDSFRVSLELPPGVNADEIFDFDWKAAFPASRQYGRDGGSALVGPVSGLDPVPVSVAVRDKGGKTVAELSGSVPVRPLDITVRVQAFSERGQIVLPDGRVDYPPREEWIEGQTAAFKAFVSPAKAVTWEWSVTGPGKIGHASWDTASVTLNGTGSLVVTVVAKVGGKEAGRAEVTLPVTVAKSKIQAAREYQAGRNEWNAARRDRAVTLMERAASLDPGNPAIERELARMKGEAEKSRAEDARKRAVEVWNQAAELQKKEKYEEALEKYREGLKIDDDKAVRDHVKKLEGFIADRKRRQEQAAADARARAEAVWRQAAELQKGKQYEEALGKYREGLAISPDPVVEEHVRKLEDYIAGMKSAAEAKKTAAAPSSGGRKDSGAETPAKSSGTPPADTQQHWGGWKSFTLAGIRYEIPAGGFQSVKSSSGKENGKYPFSNYDYYVNGKRVAIVRIGTLAPGLTDGKIKGLYTGKTANRIFDSLSGEGTLTLGGRKAYYLLGSAPGVTRKFYFVADGAEGGMGAYLHVVAGSGSGWKKYAPMFEEIAGKMSFTAGKTPPSQGGADKGAGTLPPGWKSVTIGNVTFGIPSSWNGKTMKEHDVEQLHVYWQGSFDNPVHGVSGGVTRNYGEAKKDLHGARTVSLGGTKVLRADEDGAVNLLFPPMGSNRGVALVLFRGKGGKQETLEAILKTVTVK